MHGFKTNINGSHSSRSFPCSRTNFQPWKLNAVNLHHIAHCTAPSTSASQNAAGYSQVPPCFNQFAKLFDADLRGDFSAGVSPSLPTNASKVDIHNLSYAKVQHFAPNCCVHPSHKDLIQLGWAQNFGLHSSGFCFFDALFRNLGNPNRQRDSKRQRMLRVRICVEFFSRKRPEMSDSWLGNVLGVPDLHFRIWPGNTSIGEHAPRLWGTNPILSGSRLSLRDGARFWDTLQLEPRSQQSNISKPNNSTTDDPSLKNFHALEAWVRA